MSGLARGPESIRYEVAMSEGYTHSQCAHYHLGIAKKSLIPHIVVALALARDESEMPRT